jgi:hypothetical protein
MIVIQQGSLWYFHVHIYIYPGLVCPLHFCSPTPFLKMTSTAFQSTFLCCDWFSVNSLCAGGWRKPHKITYHQSEPWLPSKFLLWGLHTGSWKQWKLWCTSDINVCFLLGKMVSILLKLSSWKRLMWISIKQRMITFANMSEMITSFPWNMLWKVKGQLPHSV